MGAVEQIEGGYDQGEGLRIAKAIEAAAADYLDVSWGICDIPFISSMIEPQKYDEGARIEYAEAVKKVVSIPVVMAGKLRNPKMCEEFIQEGRLDFVALGRTLIADPEWGNKATQGREDEISPCLSCNDGFFYY